MTTLLTLAVIFLAIALIVTISQKNQLKGQVSHYSEHCLALQGEIDTYLATIKENNEEHSDLKKCYKDLLEKYKQCFGELQSMKDKEAKRKAQWAEARKKRHQNQNKEEKK